MKYFILSCIITISAFAQPSWIDTPTTDKYIGGVGIVESKLDRRVAKIKARASLLETIKVTLSSNSKLTKIQDENGKYNKSFSREIIQKANGYLESSFVKDTYTESDGTFYIWVVIDR
ncbi:MAG: LPP20 family lipoprotein [Campylobacterota bacterium]|nr:LPP20 family lipoprotein [Campylobacterota bacterium]